MRERFEVRRAIWRERKTIGRIKKRRKEKERAAAATPRTSKKKKKNKKKSLPAPSPSALPPEDHTSSSCKAATVCPPGVATVAEPTPSSDRMCARVETNCDPGQYVTVEQTATSDRACASCEPSTFSTGVNAAECTPWSFCGPGQRVSLEPWVYNDRQCTVCDGVTGYMDEANHTSATCKAVRAECDAATELEVAGPTPTSDRRCASTQGSGGDTGALTAVLVTVLLLTALAAFTLRRRLADASA